MRTRKKIGTARALLSRPPLFQLFVAWDRKCSLPGPFPILPNQQERFVHARGRTTQAFRLLLDPENQVHLVVSQVGLLPQDWLVHPGTEVAPILIEFLQIAFWTFYVQLLPSLLGTGLQPCPHRVECLNNPVLALSERHSPPIRIRRHD